MLLVRRRWPILGPDPIKNISVASISYAMRYRTAEGRFEPAKELMAYGINQLGSFEGIFDAECVMTRVIQHG